MAHYHRGEFPQVEECVKQLDAIAAKLEEKAQAEAAEEEKKAREANKNDADIAKAKDEKLKNAREPIAPVEKATAELRDVQLLARGETDKAREQFDKAGDIPKLRQAKYQFLCGQHDKSVESLKAAVQSADAQVMPLAVQVDLLRHE